MLLERAMSLHDTPLEQDRRHGPVHNACRRYTTITTITRLVIEKDEKASIELALRSICLNLIPRKMRGLWEKFFYFSFVIGAAHVIGGFGGEGEGEGGYYGDSYIL